MQVAFSVVKTEGIFNRITPLLFDKFTADIQSGFNLTTGIFFAPLQGTYVSHICSRNYYDEHLNPSIFINNIEHSFLDAEISQGETVGRNFVMYHEKNWPSYYNHDFKGISDAQGLQTAWTMFRLDDLIQPLIGFSATSISSMSTAGVMQFDGILINHGNAWDMNTNEFTVPISGAYFFSLCTSTNSYSVQRVQIQVNNQSLVEITVSDTIIYFDIFCNTFLKQLSQNDKVRVYLKSGEISGIFPDANNFMGFLYKPFHKMEVAWSVHRTTNATGPLEPVSFDYIMINLGNGWNSSNHEIVSPISGIYYLHLNAANQASQMVNMQVVWNGAPYINIIRENTNALGVKTNGRAIMTSISEGDKLHVKLASGTQIYSDINKQTSFSGFLLYPNV